MSAELDRKLGLDPMDREYKYPPFPFSELTQSEPFILKTTEYQEVQQDPDQSDSDMMEVITDHLNDGWELVEYKWTDGIKVWTFRK